MSSAFRFPASTKEGFTRFVKPESPCYSDNGNSVLFPFSFSNGELNISFAGNNFETQMITTTGRAPSDETETAIRVIGGPRLVTSLGENFKTYIRAWRTVTIDAGSPITVEIPSHVIRVQEADLVNVTADSGNSYLISNNMPASDNYISGYEANNYNTKYVFRTPLTFSIMESGVKKYITFRTILDQE